MWRVWVFALGFLALMVGIEWVRFGIPKSVSIQDILLGLLALFIGAIIALSITRDRDD